MISIGFLDFFKKGNNEAGDSENHSGTAKEQLSREFSKLNENIKILKELVYVALSDDIKQNKRKINKKRAGFISQISKTYQNIEEAKNRISDILAESLDKDTYKELIANVGDDGLELLRGKGFPDEIIRNKQDSNFIGLKPLITEIIEYLQNENNLIYIGAKITECKERLDTIKYIYGPINLYLQ